MQHIVGLELQVGGGTHLNPMVSIVQAAADQLLVAQHFALNHRGRQVAVCGRCHTPAFRPQARRHGLAFQCG